MSLENKLIKNAHVLLPYTQEQMEELSNCADPVTGPLYFIRNFFYIQHPVRGRMKFEPFEFQVELLENYHNNRFSINMISRQCGKTTCAAGYLLWFAMFKPDSTILVAAHKYTGAQEIMQRIRYAYESCPDHIRSGTTNYNKGSIEFDNGSRIVSATTTENTGRGMAISLLYSDEFSFVRPTIASEFWTSMRPTLSTGGKAIITSTPNNDEDQFAEIWKLANFKFDEHGNETVLGKNGFSPYLATWERHPERDHAWEVQERASIGDDRFEREHNCRFIIAEETLIAPSKLVTLSGVDPIEKHGEVRWYEKPRAGFTYAVALDPSLGTGGDPAAIQIWNITNMTQVGEWKHNLTNAQQQAKILREICKYIVEETKEPENLYYSLENNSYGEAALNAIFDIGEENFPGQLLSEPTASALAGKRLYRKGFTTSNKPKLAACAKLKLWIETDRMVVRSKPLISQLKDYIASGNSYAAKIGKADDLVAATLIVIRMALFLKKYDAEIGNTVRDGLHTDEDFVEPFPFYIL